MDDIIDDERNELVSSLAFYLGAAVIVASLVSLALTLIGVAWYIWG